MPRVYTRKTTRPDTESEQTHDNCEWLNEEDREKDVPGHRRDGYRHRRAPAVAQHESRDDSRQDNPGAENRRGDDRNKRGVGLVGILALGRRAATVGLCLRDDSL